MSQERLDEFGKWFASKEAFNKFKSYYLAQHAKEPKKFPLRQDYGFWCIHVRIYEAYMSELSNDF